MSDKSRILSKKDDIKQTEAKKIIDHFRADSINPLITTRDYLDYREEHCGYCGRPMDKLPARLHFREWFHASCVEKMLDGETN